MFDSYWKGTKNRGPQQPRLCRLIGIKADLSSSWKVDSHLDFSIKNYDNWFTNIDKHHVSLERMHFLLALSSSFSFFPYSFHFECRHLCVCVNNFRFLWRLSIFLTYAHGLIRGPSDTVSNASASLFICKDASIIFLYLW